MTVSPSLYYNYNLKAPRPGVLLLFLFVLPDLIFTCILLIKRIGPIKMNQADLPVFGRATINLVL